MNKNVLHTIIVFLTSYTVAFAQSDTITVLKNVSVAAQRYNTLPNSQYIFRQDSLAKLWQISQTMAEFLTPESTVHVRQYAPGSVATYSARGATSGQSVVLWGGFSINAAGTGLTDLSLVPHTFFNASLARGGSTALFGSGAIGSAINLATLPTQKGFHLQISQRVGSFQTYNTAAITSYTKDKFYGQTKFDFAKSANSYSYTNPLSAKKEKLTRKNAAYNQQNISQQLGWFLTKKMTLETEFWYTQAHRESPRNVLSSVPGQAFLDDKTLRTSLTWRYANKKSTTEFGYAFLNEWQNYVDPLLPDFYGRPTDDTNRTRTHIIRVDQFYNLHKKWRWQMGGQFRFDAVAGSNRTGSQKTTSLQSGFYYSHQKLTANAALRLEARDQTILVPAPLISAKYALTKTFFVVATAGYNYRLPTLNDRYWQPGGNPNLKSEQGLSSEMALLQIIYLNTVTLNWRLSGFLSHVENYIQWVPTTGTVWQPENVKTVALRGIDANVNLNKKIGVFQVNLDVGGSLNDSKSVRSYLANDPGLGHQLVYMPKYKTNTQLSVGYKGFTVGGNLTTVSQTSPTYDGTAAQIGGYRLLGAGISKNIQLKKTAWQVKFNIDNLLNTSYQTILYFPMPGRMYFVTFKFYI